MERKTLLACVAASVWVAWIFATGCIDPPPRSAFAPPASVEVKSTHLLALSTYAGSIGTVIDASGTNLPGPSGKTAKLHFVGRFMRADGKVDNADFEADTRTLDASTIRWSGFGPYANPFSSDGGATGVFDGTVGVRLYDASGAMTEDDSPISINFDVKPSIVVRQLEPTTASCNGSVERAIGGAAYRMRVEAVGFEPVEFTYTLSVPSNMAGPIAVRHLAGGRFDSVGESGDFVFPAVPLGAHSYDVVVTVEGRDVQGRSVTNAFGIVVRRPLDIFYDGNVNLAEISAPVPVSGCIPGGEAGRMVQYGESMEDSRMKSFEVNWNTSWLTAHTVSQGTMGTVGTSDTNGIGFSSSDQTNWNWSLGSEVNGSLSIDKLVELGMSVNQSMGGGGTHETENSGSHDRSINSSETTTDTREASMQTGGEMGGNFSWQTSSSQSISRDFGGMVIAGTYGVFYRQTLRLLRRASVVTYNQCGAATVVGGVDFSDWAWSPDLALGMSCPPLPASNLPAAKCVVPPCAGD